MYREGEKTRVCLREFPGTPRNGTPFWEASHTIPINSWKFMGSLWEPHGKGVPFLGAPGNFLDVCKYWMSRTIVILLICC